MFSEKKYLSFSLLATVTKTELNPDIYEYSNITRRADTTRQHVTLIKVLNAVGPGHSEFIRVVPVICCCRQNVLLRFESFELEEPLSGTTCYDAVTVYDGATDESPVIGSYCGTELPSDILASTNHLFVVFQSDSSDTATGFRAHYSAKHGTGAVDGKNYRQCDGMTSMLVGSAACRLT